MNSDDALLAVTDGTVQYEGPGVELAFPYLDQSDPLLLLQLQHRYTAVCLALKHTLRYNIFIEPKWKIPRLMGEFTQITKQFSFFIYWFTALRIPFAF